MEVALEDSTLRLGLRPEEVAPAAQLVFWLLGSLASSPA
jgi:hypothetical protein